MSQYIEDNQIIFFYSIEEHIEYMNGYLKSIFL